MLKVLLVDDEPFIIQGLSVLIDWEKEGFEIAATKSNGLEALEYLRKNKVDVILADIKMPAMTGLQLLEKIREEKISEAYFVILSGYGDFSYAQQAIRYNCTDYILKPMERSELLELLDKIRSQLKISYEEEQSNRTFQRAYLERNVIALLTGKYDSVNLEYVKKHMQLSDGVCYVDLEFIDILRLKEEKEEGELRALQRELYKICQELLREDGTHVVFDVSPDDSYYDVGLILCDYMHAKEDRTQEEYLEAFIKNLGRLMDYPISMFVGKKVKDISSISQSYGAACILRSMEPFRAEKQIYYYDKEIHVGSGEALCKQSLDDLISAIELNDKVAIHQKVDALFEEMQRIGVGSGDTITLNINYLLFRLIHLATEQDNEVDQDEILHFISEHSFEKGILRGGNAHLTKFSSEFAEYLVQLRKNVSRGVLQDVEKEIRTNFAENLTLRDLGKKYFVNSSYLGQIFQKKYGKSFKDYLTEYRIQEAARMLLKTDEKISMIAETVGYKDCDYFIRKFIDVMGCTPTRYRKTQKKE
ncbi:MAG: response regulator [Clostridiales bacterium]|nr:response regulator [Candidatus Blautia equi]